MSAVPAATFLKNGQLLIGIVSSCCHCQSSTISPGGVATTLDDAVGLAFDGPIRLVSPHSAKFSQVTGVDTVRLLDQVRGGSGGRIARGIKAAAGEVVMLAYPSNRHCIPLA